MKTETIINDNAGVLTFTTPAPKLHIQTIDITAKEWFDKSAGNSYFSARVVLNFQLPGELSFELPFQYGYGDHYKDMVMRELINRKLISADDRTALWRYCDENNIVLRCNKIERCLKRDVVAFGSDAN